MAKHCRTDHYDDCLTLNGVQDQIEEVLVWAGKPFADGSILQTFAVCGLAAGHVKVALSGDGGDELFAGYRHYPARALLRWYTRLPKMVRGGVRKLISSFPEPGFHHSAGLLKKRTSFSISSIVRPMNGHI